MGNDEVRLVLEGDLDGGLPEKKRVVARTRLHGEELRGLALRGSPRLVSGIREIWHGIPRPRRHDHTPLHRLRIDRSRREIQADLGAFLTFFNLDEDSVSDDDQVLLSSVHRREGVEE